MIKRIVKMSFHPDKVDDFVLVFKENRQRIASFEGCSSLELLQDVNRENIFFTYSVWDNENALEKYRNSELFESVWQKTKALFNDKPEAWSVKNR